MLERTKMVPELMVTDLAKSLTFWVSLLGFNVAYQRSKDGFAYLDLDGAHVMLEQVNPTASQWLSAPLCKPFGRGVNFQVEISSVAPIIRRLSLAGHALYKECSDTWYQANFIEICHREFLVQDPDGYLVRIAERVSERPISCSN